MLIDANKIKAWRVKILLASIDMTVILQVSLNDALSYK